MRATEEGTHMRPRIFTLDLASGHHDMTATDTDPYANNPHQYDITDIEMPADGRVNPLLKEYLEQPVLVDFATVAEGADVYLTFLQFDESPAEGKEHMATHTLRVRHQLGQFTASYVNMSGNSETDKQQQGTLEEVSFTIEPKAASIDGSYGICVGDEGQLPQVRAGGYLLTEAYFPDIGHTDQRLRIGPFIEAVEVSEQEFARGLGNDQP